MTNDDGELEQLLRDLPLRRPPLAMDRRVRAAFAPRWPRWAVPTAVAAGLAVTVGIEVGRLAVDRVARSIPPSGGTIATATRPATDVAVVVPTRVDRQVSREVSDGVVVVTDNVPYERVHRLTVRETWYLDPRTGARVRVEVPTDEVVLRPAEVY